MTGCIDSIDLLDHSLENAAASGASPGSLGVYTHLYT